MELAVRHNRESQLGQHVANEPDIATGVMRVLDKPLCKSGRGEGTATSVGQEGLLGCCGKRALEAVQKVCDERRTLLRRRRAWVWSNGLAFTSTLICVGTAAVDLKVRIGVSAVQYRATGRAVLRHAGVDVVAVSSLLEVHCCVGGIEVGLT